METALQELLLSLREAMLIWLAAVAFVAVGLTGYAFVSTPDRRYRLRRVAVRVKGADARHRVRPTAEPRVGRVRSRLTRFEAEADLRRYAEEVAVAASRAALTAQRKEAELVAAQRLQEAAGRAYETAEAAASRVIRAMAFPMPFTPLTPSEFADREQYLHRVATEAHARGELSVQQLDDALAHRNGWDPTLHPFEQQVVLRTAVRDRLLGAFQAATAIERAAWHANEVAAAAKRSLADEALAAAMRVRRELRRPATAPTHGARVPGVAGAPKLAMR